MKTKRKALIAATIGFAVLALIAIIWGGSEAGWDFLAWFNSPQFIVFCALLGVYLIAVIGVFVREWCRK